MKSINISIVSSLLIVEIVDFNIISSLNAYKNNFITEKKDE